MPYQSRAQQGFLHSQHPEIAARWDRKTSKKQFAKLPQYKVKKAAATGVMGQGVAIPEEMKTSRKRISELDRLHTFRTRHEPGKRVVGAAAQRGGVHKDGHWSDKLVGHHQARIAHHQAQIDRLSTFTRKKPTALKPPTPVGKPLSKAAELVSFLHDQGMSNPEIGALIGKRLPGETKPQAFQRHQKQAAGLITAGAAVPALLALRSGRAASTAMAAGNTAEHAMASGMQLRHAATATALGGIAGATGALPVPHRILAINPKRNKKPKIKASGAGSPFGKRRRPYSDSLHDPHKRIRRPQHRLEHGLFDDHSLQRGHGKPPAHGYDNSGVGKAWDRSKKEGVGALGAGSAGIVAGTNQNNLADTYASTARRFHGARLSHAQGQLAGARAERAFHAPQPKGLTRAQSVPGMSGGAARRSALAPRTARIKAAQGGVNRARASINAIPKVQRAVAERSAIAGFGVGIPLAYAGARKLASRNVGKALGQPVKPHDVDAATLGALGGSAVYHGAGYGSKPLERRMTRNLNPSQKLTLASHKEAHGIGPNHPAGAKEWKPFFRQYPKTLPAANLKRAMSFTHGGKAGLATQAAMIGAGAAGAVHLQRRKNVLKSDTGVDMSVDAWGIDRPDLVTKSGPPPWVKAKGDKDEDEKMTSDKAKKRKASKHSLPPSFASHMGKAFNPKIATAAGAGYVAGATTERVAQNSFNRRKAKVGAAPVVKNQPMIVAPPPTLPRNFDLPDVGSVTMDGQSGYVFSDPGIGEVNKNWDNSYYGSAPVHRQKSPGQGPSAAGSAFAGAAAGAAAPKLGGALKTNVPKIKRAGRAAGVALRTK